MNKPLIIGGYSGMTRLLDGHLGGSSSGMVDWVESVTHLDDLPTGTRLWFVKCIHPAWWPVGVEAAVKLRGFELMPVSDENGRRAAARDR